MEPRHTLGSAPVSGELARWSLSHVLPWICLVVVMSTTACGIQLAAVSMWSVPVVDGPDEKSAALSRHDAGVPRGVFLSAASIPSTRTVMITGHEAATGERMQVECVTTSDRYAEDALLVELKELHEVSAQICIGADAPPVRP
jgi:hypothetical protein